MPLPSKVVDLIPLLGLIPHPENGFFVETWRSGSEPMSTMGQTGLDCINPATNLVTAHGRAQYRPDGDERRNCLTSIYWVPTTKSPTLLLATNLSDHVHYYQGGKPFQYILYDPEKDDIEKVILGPELHNGHKLQVPVKGGIWKCGYMLMEHDKERNQKDDDADYTIIGEAVAPGFDFHDFAWITQEQINSNIKDSSLAQLLKRYVHENATEISQQNRTVDEATEFYQENSDQKRRIEERSII